MIVGAHVSAGLVARSGTSELDKERSFQSTQRGLHVTAEARSHTGRVSRRPRWRSCLGLVVLAVALMLAGFVPVVGWPPWKVLFPPVVGLSEEDIRQLDEVRKLGGEASIMKRTPRFLGRFALGGHDLLNVSFSGKAFDDEALARFLRTYRDRIGGLDLRNTGITDAGLRHLAGLPHIEQLTLGNQDLHGFPGVTYPQNKITDAGLVHLRGLKELGSLSLGGLPITDAGLDSLKDLPNLGGLYLDRTQVGGTAFGRLKSLPRLAVLYLDESRVTENGLSHLKGATNLQVLSLARLPLTGQGLIHVKALPRLERLSVSGCRLNPVEIDDFRAARPTLKWDNR